MHEALGSIHSTKKIKVIIIALRCNSNVETLAVLWRALLLYYRHALVSDGYTFLRNVSVSNFTIVQTSYAKFTCTYTK
jgi:predicted CDP-diglyceride synthetase/phosphatidate cytidylyltransferase